MKPKKQNMSLCLIQNLNILNNIIKQMKEQKTHVPMCFVLFMFGFKINRNHKMQMKLYDFCFHLKEIKKKKQKQKRPPRPGNTLHCSVYVSGTLNTIESEPLGCHVIKSPPQQPAIPRDE